MATKKSTKKKSTKKGTLSKKIKGSNKKALALKSKQTKAKKSIKKLSKNKGYIYVHDTGDLLAFQYNPTQIPYSRSAKYGTIDSPGMSYPLTQYIGGEVREFPIEIFMYDRPYTGAIRNARLILNRLLPPEKNKKDFKKPPTFTLSYGYFTKKCVLLSMEVVDEMLDSSGRQVMTTFNLTVRQVGVV